MPRSAGWRAEAHPVGELVLGVLVLALIAGGGIVVIDALIIRRIRRLAAADRIKPEEDSE
jgi:hypothetical protein